MSGRLFARKNRKLQKWTGWVSLVCLDFQRKAGKWNLILLSNPFRQQRFKCRNVVETIIGIGAKAFARTGAR